MIEMDDDEIVKMVLAAGFHSGIPISGIRLDKKSVVVKSDDRTATFKRITMPTLSANDIGRELRRRLGV